MVGAVDLSSAVLRAGLAATALALGLLAGLDPKLAVAAAIGLAFVAIVLGDLTVGLCAFTLVAFTDNLPSLGGATLSFTKIAGLLLAISWLATLATRREDRPGFVSTHPMFAYALLMFLGWALLSLRWAEDPAEGAGAVFRYALNAILFLIVFTAVRERRHPMWVAAAFVAGATVSAIYGLLSPVEYDPYDVTSRLGGAGVDPNEIAASLVAGLILAGALFAARRGSGFVRIAALTAVGICAAGIFLSLSRGGLLALGVALIASVFAGGRWRGAAALLAIAVGLGAVGYFGFVAQPEARERVTTAEGGTGRSDIWRVGWRMVEGAPLQGVGVGQFSISSIHYLLEPGALQRDEFIVDTPKVAHNIYLQVLAELGIVGLVLFVSILGFSLSCALRAARAFRRLGERHAELIARAVFVALAGILAADFFVSEHYSKQLWLLLALGPALLALARQGQVEAHA
jgi:O-antigen ligase